MKRLLLISLALLFAALSESSAAIPTLILNGRNNHDWRTTSASLCATLESTGLFEVSVSTAPESTLPSPPHAPKNADDEFAKAKARYDAAVKSAQPALDAQWQKWLPDFAKYKVVVLV